MTNQKSLDKKKNRFKIFNDIVEYRNKLKNFYLESKKLDIYPTYILSSKEKQNVR